MLHLNAILILDFGMKLKILQALLWEEDASRQKSAPIKTCSEYKETLSTRSSSLLFRVVLHR